VDATLDRQDMNYHRYTCLVLGNLDGDEGRDCGEKGVMDHRVEEEEVLVDA
jgi:hypothetical protein